MVDNDHAVPDPAFESMLSARHEALLVVEKKLDGLKILGVQTGSIENRIDSARRALESGNFDEAKKRLDEILVFFSIVADEIERIFTRMESPQLEDNSKMPGQPPAMTLEEIEATVEEAFLKHLHSSGLRRMVEVISIEKIRTLLGDEDFYEKVIRKGVEKALADLGGGAGTR